MRILKITLGAILTVYCSAGVLSETFKPNDIQVNNMLCHFLLCNNAPLVWRARDLRAAGGREDLDQAIGMFRKALQQDPQDPYRWADIGDAFLEAGDEQDARYSYNQVLSLAPHSAYFRLRTANFHFQIDEEQEALTITAQILKVTPEYDSLIFTDYITVADNSDNVLRFGIPDDRRAARAWLDSLMQAGRVDDVQRTWDWVAGHGYADDALAGRYAEFLIRQGRPDSAASAWTSYLGARAPDYGKSAYLFNGGFESEPIESPFDWKLVQTEGAEVARDCTTAWSGQCSLRIAFAGTQNLDFSAASQFAVVRQGRYRFQAFVRTEGLTTDQGIRFRISDVDAPARLDVKFGQFTGSRPWSAVESDLTIGPETRLLQIQVIRSPSLKFDNKIGGTAWIDDLSLERVLDNTPR